MPSTTKLIGVGFLGSLGLTFLVLGCVLSGKWYALLLFLLYGFTPLPLLFVQRNGYESFDSGETNKSLDIAMFFVSGMVVSTFALPLFLTRVPVDNPGMDTTNCFLAEFATILFYTTAGLFLLTSEEEEF